MKNVPKVGKENHDYIDARGAGIQDADVRHHLRSDKVATAIIRPDAIRAVRAALSPPHTGSVGR